MKQFIYGHRWMLAGAAFVALLLVLQLAGCGDFLNIGGLVIVVGGSVANAFLSFQRPDVIRAFNTIRDMVEKVQASAGNLHLDIMQMLMWSHVVQQKDMVGLDKEVRKKNHDALLRYGLDLVLSGYSADNIRQMMHTAADAEFERRCTPVTVLRNMASSAPAFGMVGTLIGMVVLLKNGSGDMAGIEGGLGVAMLSTLYGILLARLVCLPAADKLLQKEEKQQFRNYMVAEGLAMLAEKRRPLFMQDRLNSFLDPSMHLDVSNHMHAAFQHRVAMAV